mgnify:FL=1
MIYNKNNILYSIIITFFVALLLSEVYVGIKNSSTVVIADSIHVILDIVAIVIGLITSVVSVKHSHPGKIIAIGGFINAVTLLLLSIQIILSSFEKVIFPDTTYYNPNAVFLVGIISTIVNIIAFIIITYFIDKDELGEHDHNHKGVSLHILGDLLGSVMIMVSSICFMKYGYWWVEIAGIFLIGCILFPQSFSLMKNTIGVLLDDN